MGKNVHLPVANLLPDELIKPLRIVEDRTAPIVVEDEEILAFAISELVQMRDRRGVDFLREQTKIDDLTHEPARLDTVIAGRSEPDRGEVGQRAERAPYQGWLRGIAGIIAAETRAEQSRDKNERPARLRRLRRQPVRRCKNDRKRQRERHRESATGGANSNSMRRDV